MEVPGSAIRSPGMTNPLPGRSTIKCTKLSSHILTVIEHNTGMFHPGVCPEIIRILCMQTVLADRHTDTNHEGYTTPGQQPGQCQRA